MRTGVVKAVATSQPKSSILTRIRLALMPVSSAHAAKACVCPACVRCRVVRLLRACALLVAQMQLLGAYGPLLFARSSVARELGRRPISAKKFSNFRHRRQTRIPRPPYLP